jgi:hypothetical protein
MPLGFGEADNHPRYATSLRKRSDPVMADRVQSFSSEQQQYIQGDQGGNPLSIF